MGRTDGQRKRSSTGTAGAAIWVACLFLVWMGWPQGAAAQPEAASAGVPLVFAGSGTNLPLVRILAAEFGKLHPRNRIEVPTSIGSTGGIRAAADGAVALGLISRALRPEETAMGLTVRPYARTPVLIAVNPSVPDSGITYAELLDIYRGTRTQWQNGRPIVVLTREPGDSSIDVLIRAVPGFEDVYLESQRADRWATLLKDLVMNRTLAQTPDAIGLSDLGALTIEKHAIRPLPVNGVAPTLGNLRAGAYPLFKTLSFVYREENLSEATKRFIDFVGSPQGAEIMRNHGYLSEY